MLAAILVPVPPARFGAAYARFALRDGNAIAVASVAAGLTLNDGNVLADLRMALGAVAPIPKMVPCNGALVGRLVEDVADEAAQAAMAVAEPISDIRGSAEYRRRLIGVLAKRAILAAAQRAERNRR